MSGALGLSILSLAAAVLPLKPPLSAEGRRNPGPTVIRAGALKETDEVTARVRRQQAEELEKRREEEIERAKRQASELVTRLERITVEDIERERGILGKMREAGMAQERIDAMRKELEDGVRQIRAEGGRLRAELKARGLEVPAK